MLTSTFLLAVMAATSAFVSALPAKVQQQELAAAAIPKVGTLALYTTVSPDGSCGGKTEYTCEGSDFGNCCNVYGTW